MKHFLGLLNQPPTPLLTLVPSTPVSDRGGGRAPSERASKGGELISKLHHNGQLIEFAMRRAHANNFVFRLFVRLVL